MPRIAVVFIIFIVLGLIGTVILFFVLDAPNQQGAQTQTPTAQKKEGDAGILVSEDSGATWKDLEGSEGLKPSLIEFRKTGAGHMYVGTNGQGLWIQKEGKTNLERVTDTTGVVHQDADILALRENTSGEKLYLGIFQNKYGQLVRLTEDGALSLYTTPLAGYGVFGVALSGSGDERVTIASGDGNFLETSDIGKNQAWEPIARTREGLIRVIQDPENPSKLWALGNKQSLYATDAGGRLWKEKGIPRVDGRSVGTVYQLVYHTTRKSLIAATAYGLIESTDDGSTWTAFRTPVPVNTLPIRAFEYSPKFKEVFWMATEHDLYRTDDGGISWYQIPVTTKKTISLIRLDPFHSKKIYVGLAE